MNTRFFLAEGLLISRHGQTLEYSRRTGQTLQFADVDDGLVHTLTESQFFEEYLRDELQVLENAFSSQKELLTQNKDESCITPDRTVDLCEMSSIKFKDDVLRRHAYVTGMKKFRITKGQLTRIEHAIPEIALKISDSAPPRPITVATWMRNFDRSHGSVAAITDPRAFGSRRLRRSSKHSEIISKVIDEYYLVRVPLSVGELHRKYEQAMRAWQQDEVASGRPPERTVSPRTFYRIVSDLDHTEVTTAHLGREEARRATRFMKGHLQGGRALQHVEIDHALLDMYVIDDALMIPLGRPWLTAFRDRYSGAIIGFYVSFSGPSVDSIFAGLRHSLYPHDRANQIWTDIDNVLPHGFAETYVSDRGTDFMSQRYRLGIAQIGADFEYCAVRSPWLKGSVERFFLTLNELLETIPGKTFRNLHERRDYDPAKQSVCRFSSFVWILYKWAADAYNVRRSRGRSASPLELFNESIASYPSSYPRNPQAVEVILGERRESLLHHDGIKFKGLHFLGRELGDLYRHCGPRTKVVWHLNSTNLACIRVLNPRTGEFFRADCSRPDYANGRSLIQHEYIRKLAAATERQSSDPVDGYVRAMNDIRERIGEEVLARENSSKKRFAALAGITSEAVLDGKQPTVGKIFVKDPPPPPEPRQTMKFDVGTQERPFTDVPSFGWSVR